MSKRHGTGRCLALSSITLGVLALVNQASAQQADASVARVEVTGSSIKRAANEEALPVSVVKAEEMDQRGMTTLADLMMAIPQSLSLAPSNAGSGTNINMRGLGVNRTLVLLNGRRLANEAISDGYANLDVIPKSALQRVEVLRDGASSIYGSDAIGGVVNFITRPSFNGAQVTLQGTRPQHSGGGDEQRASFIVGRGDLAVDGWNVYATFDGHRRSRLLASDRDWMSSPELMTSIGRAPSLASGGYAMPANFTTSASKTARNPLYAEGCAAPYSIQGAKNTCVLDDQTYGTALYGNQQLTFYARASYRPNPNHTFFIDYSRGQEYILGTKNPTQALAVDGVNPLLPSTSKWYPGGSGGVPAVAGLKGEPLNLTWSVADLGPATTKDVQLNQRLSFNAEGTIGEWDYKAGVSIGNSQRDGYYHSGYVIGQGLLDGLKSGVLNPFGLQDQAGLDYLKSIGVDGARNRDSTSTYKGLDATFSRSVMELAGGAMGVAVGVDLHRDTTQDTKLPIGAQVTYAKSSPSHGEGQRNVAAIYAELDAPVTKNLDLNFAVRDDHFSDFGNTINPKASFKYTVNKGLMFRGSANTGFRAPTLFDRYGYRLPGATTTTAAKWDDPVLCPGGTPGVAGTGKALPGYVESTVCNTKFDKQTGSNPDVGPEKSKGASLGVVFEPMRNATVSVDYFYVDLKDQIANLPEQVYFQNPAKYADLFVRNEDGTIDYIKNIVMNLGGQRTSGFDVSGNYRFPKSAWGNFEVQLDGTYLTKFENQLEPGGEWFQNVGRFGAANNGTTSSYPVITFRWKHTLQLRWANGPYSAQLTQNYNTGYHDQNLVDAQYFRDIKPYQVWNVAFTYKGIKHLTLAAGINNLFDRDPPTTNHKTYSYGYLSSAGSPIGRALNARATYDF